MDLLFDSGGLRKYLSAKERSRFLRVAASRSMEVYAFCNLLLETGCRISEALSLTAERFDAVNGAVVFESLKKRKKGVFRAIPISPHQVDLLRQLVEAKTATNAERIWPWSRMTAFRRIKSIMLEAKIAGAQAMPKGLRHGFAVAAIDQGIPLNIVQRWMGHASIATTAIYANAIGEEERRLARRLWRLSRARPSADPDTSEIPSKEENRHIAFEPNSRL